MRRFHNTGSDSKARRTLYSIWMSRRRHQPRSKAKQNNHPQVKPINLLPIEVKMGPHWARALRAMVPGGMGVRPRVIYRDCGQKGHKVARRLRGR